MGYYNPLLVYAKYYRSENPWFQLVIVPHVSRTWGGGGPTCKQNVNMQAFDTKFLLERRYRMFLKHSEQHAPLL